MRNWIPLPALVLAGLLLALPAHAQDGWDTDAIAALTVNLPREAVALRLLTGPVAATGEAGILVEEDEVREIAYRVNPDWDHAVETLWAGIPVDRLPVGWALWIDAEAVDGSSLGTFGVARVAESAGEGLARTGKHSGHCHCRDRNRCSRDCYWWTDSWCYCDCRCCDEPSDGAVIVGAVIVGAVVGAALSEDCSVSPATSGSGMLLLLAGLGALGVMRRRRVA